MFVARTKELATLQSLYVRDGFQMAVIYGRRRVGKTSLIDEFVRDKKPLYFTAQQKSAMLNIRSFSRVAYERFGLPATTGAFAGWQEAFAFVADRARSEEGRLVFVFDEFPYAAEAEPSLPSMLQIAIDHDFKDSGAMIILCGSNQGFMESEVLGEKSPLYGRRTAQIRLAPFDYLDASLMLPDMPAEERVRYYATFGGTPYYLAQIDSSQSYESNVERLFFDISGLLYAEPELLLRQELREPALYSSVLDAVASGATTPKRIAEGAGLDERSVGKYLATLVSLGIVQRRVPFGENPNRSRKGIHVLRDPFFAYWYRFVSPRLGAIEAGAGETVVRQTAFGSALDTYVGRQFETMCEQWLARHSMGRIPFLASDFGSWWGTDPSVREQVDIDVIAADRISGSILLGECKWRNRFDETEALRVLRQRAELIHGYPNRWYALFTKTPVTVTTAGKCREQGDVLCVSADDMYSD